ncbi:MAG: hypothetical protein ABIF77_10585 [bacterium]
MPRFRPRERFIRLFCLVLLVSGLLVAACAQAQIQLGRLSFANSPAMSLSNPTTLARGLGSYGFCGRVGGVAFGGVAEPLGDEHITGIAHDPSRTDGARLRITLSHGDGTEREVAVLLYDWQLVPVARFAGSDQDACFTMFGDLRDEAEQRAREARGDRILNYHPALENSLVGLRLFQADLLILDHNACDLPSLDGDYILGEGEAPPVFLRNQDNLARLHAAMDEKHPDGQAFQSYIICDHERPVTFSAPGDTLLLTGQPLWSCWRLRGGEAEFAAANQRSNDVGNQHLRRLQETDMEHLTVVEFNEKWNDETWVEEQFSAITDSVFSETVLERMPEYSRWISAEIERNDGVNPAVYAAVVTVMRQAALFRHVRRELPDDWALFEASLADVAVTPAVTTPTVLLAR